MAFMPLNFHNAEYAAEDGTFESWSVEHFLLDQFRCTRVIYASEADAERSFALIRQSVDILKSDPAKSDALQAEGTALYKVESKTFTTSAEAIAYFAAERPEAKAEAHELVASVDRRVGNFVA